VKAGGRWISPQSTQGSYFVFTGQQLSFPLPVRVKSVAAPGQQVEDVIQRMANEQLIEGSSQFSGGGGGGGGDDEDSGGDVDADLWPVLHSKHKCEKPNDEAIRTVQNQAECEQRAKGGGYRYYSYIPDRKSCFPSVTCNTPRKTSWDWTVFQQPGESATPKPTPAATPKPTPEATPPPTQEEAGGMCQPWCHKHEITKWGARGTDTPGAKCSWKRCGGCELCAPATVAAFQLESAPAKARKARKARKAL
jgi:hypothetical protein